MGAGRPAGRSAATSVTGGRLGGLRRCRRGLWKGPRESVCMLAHNYVRNYTGLPGRQGPPVTRRVSPLTLPFAAEPRNTTALATSSGLDIRPDGSERALSSRAAAGVCRRAAAGGG